MNKNDLVAAVAEKSGLSKAQAGDAVDAAFAAITETLKSGGEVRIIGFGNFMVSERAATEGRNPAHRRPDPDPGVEDAEVQGRQGPEGRGQQLIGFDLSKKAPRRDAPAGLFS